MELYIREIEDMVIFRLKCHQIVVYKEEEQQHWCIEI